MSNTVTRAGSRIYQDIDRIAHNAIRERWRLQAELELLAIDRDRLIGALDDLESRLRAEIAELSNRNIANKLGISVASMRAIERDVELGGLQEQPLAAAGGAA